MNWRCATSLTIPQQLPILASRHRCWWVSFVPACAASFGPVKIRHIFGSGKRDKKGAFPTFQRTKDMLEKDISTFMQRRPRACFWCTWMNTGLRVQTQTSGEVHESTCRASWCPGHGNLHRHSTPKQKSSKTCRRPIACLLPDVGTIMKERLPMDDIEMENEAILLRVATTLRFTSALR